MCIVGAMGFFFVMFASSSTTWLTKEREIGGARHVRSSEECTCKTDIHEHVVSVVANVVDDFVL